MPAITDLMKTLDYGPSPESAQPALDWLAARQSRFGLWIGGAWREGAAHFASVNPSNAQRLADVAQARAEDIDAAVQAAQAALPAWTALGARGRSRVLYAIARTLQRHARLLAVLETLDNGKAIRESRDIDIPLAIRHFYHHAGWALRLGTEFPLHRALGVVGQIVPWNFPLLMLAWKIAPALACGNTVVFKPAEQTSLTALLFAHLCEEAGVPPGVINIVTGDGRVGQALTLHAGIRKIAFTGSTEVGREIRKATAGSGKKLSLELGGKSPFIVFADADLDAAVEGIVDSIWFNQGQVCCAGSRLLVHEGTAERLLAKLRARMATIRVGDPLDKSIDMGPLVDRTQWQRVQGFVERARVEGAHITQSELGLLATGTDTCYYPPTLVTNVETSSEIVCDEVFGPVLVAQTFRTLIGRNAVVIGINIFPANGYCFIAAGSKWMTVKSQASLGYKHFGRKVIVVYDVAVIVGICYPHLNLVTTTFNQIEGWGRVGCNGNNNIIKSNILIQYLKRIGTGL